ncbi:hypothetical protein [Thiohalorhabdus methylotrophus]|uniref:Uncharacterized protein n=1 Tax=Thiohalorhabdus methylotrophus TaxID=3242694 RepID=A0ABV4TYG7_9GAMM
MGFPARYVLAVLLPPVAVIGLGRRSATVGPIGVILLAALVTYALAPWTPWMILGDMFWAAAAIWAVLTVRGAEEDERHEPFSTAEHHVSPERHYSAEDQAPREKD